MCRGVILKMYTCEICGYNGQKPSYLARHMLTHTGERAHECPTCGLRFKTVSTLNSHRQIHDSRYECETCGFVCKQYKVLQRHMLLHGNKDIACPHCHYKTCRREDLRRHIASMHAGKPRRKRYEEQVCVMLETLQVPYIREVVVRFSDQEFRRKFARIDFYWLNGETAVCFEVDEWAHLCAYNITEECKRMWLVYENLTKHGYRGVHFIRYNPHAPRGSSYSEGLRANCVRNAIAHVPEGLCITYLFYHMEGDMPRIASSPDYTLQKYVRRQSL